MIHKITIKYECPLCGGTHTQPLDKVKENIKNVFCPYCKFETPTQDVFMEPVGQIQTIETLFTEQLQYIPNRILYPDMDNDLNGHCDACNKCDDCSVMREDKFCTRYRQPCKTTCPECSSVSTKKMLFLQENHFSYEEYWSLDLSLATFILPRLKAYYENMHGFPANLSEETDGFKVWQKHVRKMILFFRMKEKDCVPFTKKEKGFTKVRQRIYEEGKKLFGEYIESLWD